MISTVHIPLYSRYSPIISLSYLFYIPITLPVIFSVLLVVFPNLPFLGGPGLGSPFFKGGRLASSRAVAFSGSRDRWSPGRRCPGMEKPSSLASYFYGVSLCCCGFWGIITSKEGSRKQNSPGLWSFKEIHVGDPEIWMLRLMSLHLNIP